MAIRPTDLQASLINTVQQQTVPTTARAEEQARAAQMAAQSQFVSQTQERSESVAETGNAEGNRVDAGGERNGEGFTGGKRRRAPATPFEEVVDEAAGLDAEQHLIDFTA